MNVFVTGATGFLGTNLLKKLVLDRRINKIYALVRNPRTAELDRRVEYINGDLASLKGMVLDGKVDAVVHLAAAIRENKEADLYTVNVDGTRNVVEFCRKNRIDRLLFTSSVNVYLKHQGVYAKTKVLAEDVVKGSGLKYCIFRVAMVYGLHDLTLSRLIDFARKYHFVPVFGDGKKLEQPVYVEEAAEFLRNALFLNKSGYVVDVAGKEAYPYNEMLRLVCRVLGQKAVFIHIPVPLLVAAIGIFKKIGIRIPLNIEQIYHTDEDLSSDMSREAVEFSVVLRDMERNLREYLLGQNTQDL